MKPLWTGGTLMPGEQNGIGNSHLYDSSAVDSAELDGRTVIVSVRGRDVMAWDPGTGALVRKLSSPELLENRVRCGALDGRAVAVSAGADRAVRIWDLESGETVHVLKGHSGDAKAMAFSEVGKTPVLAVGCGDKKIRVWDLSTGKRLRILDGHESKVLAIEAARIDGRPVAVSRDTKAVHVWDLSTGDCLSVWSDPDPLLRSAPDRFGCTEIDGRAVVGYGVSDADAASHIRRGQEKSEFVVRELATGTKLQRMEDKEGAGYNLEFSRGLGFSVLGAEPVLVAPYRTNVRAWSLVDGRRVAEFATEPQLSVQAIACATVNARAVVVTGHWAAPSRVWDLATGAAVHTFSGHLWPVEGIKTAIVDGRECALSWGRDHTVRVWDAETGQQRQILSGFNGDIATVGCVEVDGRSVALVGLHGMGTWPRVLDSGEESSVDDMRYSGMLAAMAITRENGELLIAILRHSTVGVWHGDRKLSELDTGELSRERQGARHHPCRERLAFANVNGGTRLVVAHPHGEISLWDPYTGARTGGARIHDRDVLAIATTVVDGVPVGVSAAREKRVRVTNLSTMEVMHTLDGHTGAVEAIAVGETGGRPVAVTGSGDHSARVWDLLTGKETHRFELPGGVRAVALGGGRLFAGAGRRVYAYALP